MSGEKIYTTCQNNTGDGEVRVMDLNGNLKNVSGSTQTYPTCSTVPTI